jgi:hypothetical protein
MDISCQLKLGGVSYPQVLESRVPSIMLWRCIENGLMVPLSTEVSEAKLTGKRWALCGCGICESVFGLPVWRR